MSHARLLPSASSELHFGVTDLPRKPDVWVPLYAVNPFESSRIRENSDASPNGYEFLETTERRSGNGGTLTRFRYNWVNGVECPFYGRLALGSRP